MLFRPTSKLIVLKLFYMKLMQGYEINFLKKRGK